MKLVFNVESLRPPVTGVGHYGFHLIDEYVRSDEVESVHCFNGVGWVDAREQLEATSRYLFADVGETVSRMGRVNARLRDAVGAIPGTRAVYEALMQRRFAQAGAQFPGALYHETNYIPRPFTGPCVATVHDLSHIRYPQFHPPHLVQRLNKLLPDALDRADRVVTDSNVVRDEILEHFGLPPDKVTTVYGGVDTRYEPRGAQGTAGVLKKFGLRHQGYVLLVATLEPRKGFDLLLDAWESLPLALREEFPLILAGSSGWRNRELTERIGALSADGTVRHLGWVSSTDLPVLYSGAAVFVYPSIYEGFGLPVLDAMRSGVPVICRAGTSMAEFSQGDCLLLEHGEAQEMAHALTSLLESETDRTHWGQRGLARSNEFSWQRCARENMAVYRELL